MAVSRDEWESVDPKDVPGVPDEARRVPYEAMEAVLESLNRAVERGEVEYGDGEEWVKFDPEARGGSR